jgi:hypothetical protein
VLLAAFGDRRADVRADRAGIVRAAIGDLLERGRIDVEDIDRAQDLVAFTRGKPAC